MPPRARPRRVVRCIGNQERFLIHEHYEDWPRLGPCYK